jgi:ABC-type dipeptide/oligopeptide/nickel transport system permease subunit
MKDRRPAIVVAWIAFAATVRLARAADPRRLVLADSLAAPSLAHPFGCGEGGVDLLSLSMEASARAVLLALAIGLVSTAIGTTAGAIAGMRGRGGAATLARICDTLQALPTFILALAVLSMVRRPTRWHVAAVLAATAWAPFTRLALAEMRVIRDLAFVEASRALGASRWRVLFRHVLPALGPSARAQLGTTAAALLVSEAALAYLGVGPADGVSLGALVDQGVGAMVRAPHVLVVASATLLMSTSVLLGALGPARTRALP